LLLRCLQHLKKRIAQVSGLVLNIFGFSVDSIQQTLTPITAGPSKPLTGGMKRTTGRKATTPRRSAAGLLSPQQKHPMAALSADPSFTADAQAGADVADAWPNPQSTCSEEVASFQKMLYQYEEISRRRPSNKPFLLFLR
jgi:hypothetical protein